MKNSTTNTEEVKKSMKELIEKSKNSRENQETENENIGRKFSEFLKESNPELNEKLKAILPDILKAVADFMTKEFPDKAEELFITNTEGVSQPKMQYYAGKYYEEGFDGSELKGKSMETIGDNLFDKPENKKEKEPQSE